MTIKLLLSKGICSESRLTIQRYGRYFSMSYQSAIFCYALLSVEYCPIGYYVVGILIDEMVSQSQRLSMLWLVKNRNWSFPRRLPTSALVGFKHD